MVTIEFNYNQMITVIQAKLTDLFQDVVNKYYQKTAIPLDTIYFLVNGETIKLERTVESYMNDINKTDCKMIIFVDNIFKEEEKVIKESKDIICPECKEPCRIKIDDYFIKLYDCKNRHNINGIKINDFMKKQEINISSIICEKCKIKNKGNSNEFYYCITCKMNLCLLCKANHDINHNIIKYDQKNYICLLHNDSYVKYCNDCSNNICFACDMEHQDHKSISLIDLRPDIDKTKKRLIEIKEEIDEFNKQINMIIAKLNELIRTMNIFYEINNNIIKNYDIKNRNYEIFQNINEINNNNIILDKILNINKNNDLKNKINDIIDLYNNINGNTTKESIKKEVSENKIISKKITLNNNKNDNIIKEDVSEENEITIIYNTNNDHKIKIFGNEYVNNNKDKCHIIIDGNKKDLCEYIDLNMAQMLQKNLKLKLIGIQNVTNISHMFSGCNSLNNLPDISKWNTKKLLI